MDQDDDGDGWFDFVEVNCQSDANNSQVVPLDTDGDSLCDVLDEDDDGDGWNDTTELNCQTDPLNRTSLPLDADSDMICDLLDDDDDNDGTLDSEDQAPLDPTDTRDLDGDGIGDASDDDIDGDGFTNADETSCESNPSDANSIPIDSDGMVFVMRWMHCPRIPLIGWIQVMVLGTTKTLSKLAFRTV